MPLINDFQLDYCGLDGISSYVTFYYRPYTNLLPLIVPTIPTNSINVSKIEEAILSINITNTVPSIPTITSTTT